MQDSEELKTSGEVLGLNAPEELIKIDDSAADMTALSPYAQWRVQQTPEALYNVTKSLTPTINSVLASCGAVGNPHIAAKARVIAAKAIQSYDPEAGASLPTWVSQQLRQISRDIRKSNQVVAIPEGVQLDGYAIYRAESEFEDEHGREPSVKELADLTHMSIKRIEAVRNKLKPVVADSSTESESGEALLQSSSSDFSKDAVDYVYNDSDLTDQKLLEHITGYGGADILDNKQLMQKLKLTPVQMSRRKKRLMLRINEVIKDLEDIQ